MLKTYSLKPNSNGNVFNWIVPVDPSDVLAPGCTVKYISQPNTRGIVISYVDDEVTVLWSAAPERITYQRLNYSQIMQQVFPVQPTASRRQIIYKTDLLFSSSK